MDEPLRLRVVFDDLKMLNKSHRSEGLKHCWLLLNPCIATISHLESHVRKTFHLKRSCPNGIILYMDDFVLPPFESTCVLKDKDIIRVKKKDATGVDALELGDDPYHIQDSGVLDTKHTIDSEKNLAVIEFGEDSDQHNRKTDGDICGHENAVHTGSPPSNLKKKRKHSDRILLPKAKKLKPHCLKSDIIGEDHDNIQNMDEVVGIVLGKSPGSSQRRGRSGRNSSKNDKPSSIDGSHGISAQLENNIEQVTDSLQREKRNAQVEENIGGNTCELHVNSSVRKVQGRNALHKKEKREWVREMRPLWPKNTQNQSPTAIHKESLEKQETEQDIETEKEIVPVVIRPGHLRFQPLDEEQSPWQSHEAMETLQLNGTTGNNKGQMWHRVNNLSKWNDSNGYKEQFNRGPNCFRENLGSKWNGAIGYKGQNWVRENTGRKWNDANGYKGQKWGRENNWNKWNDANAFKEQSANGCREQFNGNQKTMSTWNDANGYKEQHNTNTGRWSNANGYVGQKWVRENTGSKWNNANGYNEQSFGNQKVMNTWNNGNGYNRQKWVRENVGRKWNGGDARGFSGQNVIRENMQSVWNATNSYKEQSNGKEMMGKRWTDANGYEDPCISKTSNKWEPSNGHKELNNSVPGSVKTTTGSCPFEGLFPLTRIPQVGDVLVYRLIELSPSWCPEVSPFRVGEVTSYNYLSMSIILVPVPEFPIFSDEDTERSDPANKTKRSPYNEDGSLNIHYPSLVDVRLLKASDSGATSSDCSEKEMNTQAAAAPVNKWELAIASTNAKEMVSQPKETGNASSSTWDQIKLAINEKKEQMQQRKDGWEEWGPSRRNVGTSWSYQATRGGPMAHNLANIRSRANKYQYRK